MHLPRKGKSVLGEVGKGLERKLILVIMIKLFEKIGRSVEATYSIIMGGCILKILGNTEL